MSTLNVLISHLSATAVREQLRLLRAVAPDARFVACHTGPVEEGARLDGEDAAWIADPSWRGAPRSFQSYSEILEQVRARWLPDAGLDAVWIFEFDHLVLDPRFEGALRDLARRTGAGMLGKSLTLRTGTNWHHYGRFRSDPGLLAQLRRFSVRDEPVHMYGTLGNGMWLARAAVEGYVAAAPHPPCYGELYVPTLVHHLGHRLVDVDAVSPLYRDVRWLPDYDRDDVERLRLAGRAFVHPVKDPDVARDALRAAATA